MIVHMVQDAEKSNGKMVVFPFLIVTNPSFPAEDEAAAPAALQGTEELNTDRTVPQSGDRLPLFSLPSVIAQEHAFYVPITCSVFLSQTGALPQRKNQYKGEEFELITFEPLQSDINMTVDARIAPIFSPTCNSKSSAISSLFS